MKPDGLTQSQDIVQRCLAQGFALAGVAPVRPTQWEPHLRAWLGRGCGGEMDYLASDLELRLDPARVLQGTRAFIVVADQYARRGDADTPASEASGRVARYARGRNYHEVMKRRLHRIADALRLRYPGSEFRTCVDTVPILERELAAMAGIGWQGKNTMLIHPRIGSWFLLGVVATTMDLTPLSASEVPAPLADACGSCTRCLDACPTDAITPYSVDASRCISYLTIEHRSLIPPPLHAAIGEWVFGCDICQEVCPHNSPRDAGQEVGSIHNAYAPRLAAFPLLQMLGWAADDRQSAFSTSAMKRATLAMMKRNALIAAGNAIAKAPQAVLLARIGEIATSPGEPELVRETARQVLARLGA